MKFVIFGGELLLLAAWLIDGRTLPLSLRLIGVIGIVRTCLESFQEYSQEG